MELTVGLIVLLISVLVILITRFSPKIELYKESGTVKGIILSYFIKSRYNDWEELIVKKIMFNKK